LGACGRAVGFESSENLTNFWQQLIVKWSLNGALELNIEILSASEAILKRREPLVTQDLRPLALLCDAVNSHDARHPPPPHAQIDIDRCSH
jgi:hypothetical protein